MNMGILPVSNNNLQYRSKQPSFRGCVPTKEAARELKNVMNLNATKGMQKSIADILKFLSASALPILIFYKRNEEYGTNLNLRIGDPSLKNPAENIDMAIDFTDTERFDELKERITTIEGNNEIVNSMGTAHRWNFKKVINKIALNKNKNDIADGSNGSMDKYVKAAADHHFQSGGGDVDF